MRHCLVVPFLPDYWEGIEYSFFAASCAVRFLDTLDSTTRKEIRNVRLEEDQQAVSECASHARGLINLCSENPELRIEHSVDLWKAILPVREETSFLYA
jgi:hypothetical protein